MFPLNGLSGRHLSTSVFSKDYAKTKHHRKFGVSLLKREASVIT